MGNPLTPNVVIKVITAGDCERVGERGHGQSANP